MKNFNLKQALYITSTILFIVFIIFYNHAFIHDTVKVKNIISPVEIELENGEKIVLKDLNTFDSYYSENNKNLSKRLGITEDEAFIYGNLGKYWASNILANRKVKIINSDLIYNKVSYKTKLENSPYAIKNNVPLYKEGFNKQLNAVRKGNYIILNLDNDMSYKISKENLKNAENFVVIRKSHFLNSISKLKKKRNIKTNDDFFKNNKNLNYSSTFTSGNLSVILSDFSIKLKPDRNCSTEICREILEKINSSKYSIDMAIYGYSSTPLIENSLERARNRGVKIRVVYDSDQKGQNIYPDTFKFVSKFNSVSDIKSPEVSKTMHNKFYIFDDSTVITGSANLSHTDMSGFNANSIIVINDKRVAKMYKNEFEQMFSGNFHNDKKSQNNLQVENIDVYFSPQDKGITKGILPIIKSAENYIYIPSFIITHNGFVRELINAKNRGVDVKIIVDSLNATGAYSKHKELRNAGILVKAENYAGKMHAKSIIVDDKYFIIGSMNFSSNGENYNDENMIIIKNAEIAKFYRNYFLYIWNKIPDKWLKLVPRAESKDSIGSCSDGLDNNYDGKIDIEDLGCKEK